MYLYNRRVIKIIRRSLALTQEQMAGVIGITRACLGTYERGRSRAGDFFCDRMIDLYGIDLRQPADFHKIVFREKNKVSPAVYAYLSELEIEEEETREGDSKPEVRKENSKEETPTGDSEPEGL